jgi:tetratricopeptide (TPR) repeat protein
MMRGKITLSLSKCFCNGLVALLMFFFLAMSPFYSQAGVVKGKVTSIRGSVMELDLGVEKGIQLGDSGKVYYNILIEGKEKPIFIAKFKITHLSEKSSMAQVEEKTGEVKVGYLVEIVFKEGELELRSDPAGAKVYVDGKEKGETPSVLSNVRLGGHAIRIAKEGYEPYEEQVKVVEGERKKISASLKRVAGSLFVNTDPSGTSVFVDGRSVGMSPYEGKDLSSGTHRVRVVKEGYETWEKDVVVEAGKGVEVFTILREKRKEVALPSSQKAKEAEALKEIGKGEGEKVSREKYAKTDNGLNAVDWFKKGYLLRYSAKNNQEAMKAFDKAIEIEPNFARAYAGRAAIYNDWGQYQQGLRESERAIKLDPTLPWGFNTRGWAHIGLLNYQKAIEDLNKAIELDPNYVSAYIHRSWAYFMLKNYNQALEDANKAIEIDPEFSAAYFRRGRALASLNKFQDAIKDFDKAIELDPTSSWSFLHRGYTLLKLNKTEQALEDLKKAANLGNNDAQNYLKKKGIQW